MRASHIRTMLDYMSTWSATLKFAEEKKRLGQRHATELIEFAESLSVEFIDKEEVAYSPLSLILKDMLDVWPRSTGIDSPYGDKIDIEHPIFVRVGRSYFA